MKIVIAESYKAMSDITFELVVEQIRERRRAVLALPTGNTPLGLYKNLVKAFKQKKVSFKQVKTFNLDEYIGLEKDNRHSFSFFLKKNLIDRVDLNPKNIFATDGKAKSLGNEVKKYENLIRKQGGIDLAILGIGLDGHIAFNEPGSKFNSKTRVVKLTEKTRRSNSQYFSGFNKVPRRAITMGLGTIMKSKKIILIASGESKAKIVKQALMGKITKSVPASILQKHKNLLVILEKEAARYLVEK